MSTSITRTIHLTIETDCENEAQDIARAVAADLSASGILPAGATAEVRHIEPDWLDKARSVRDADHVDVSWLARGESGRALFSSSMVLTPEEAAAMFFGIGGAQ